MRPIWQAENRATATVRRDATAIIRPSLYQQNQIINEKIITEGMSRTSLGYKWLPFAGQMILGMACPVGLSRTGSSGREG